MADIRGDDGNDTLDGTAQADRIRGDKGSDLLRGLGGNDQLEGDDGNDRLLGGAGRDTLEGDQGNDVLTGGGGADVFRYSGGDDADVVTDFQDGVDRILISDPAIDGFEDLTVAEDAAGSAVVSFLVGNDPTSITLRGVDADVVSASDFIFSPG
jgi:serralysin